MAAPQILGLLIVSKLLKLKLSTQGVSFSLFLLQHKYEVQVFFPKRGFSCSKTLWTQSYSDNG